jgi:hypothetical protein
VIQIHLLNKRNTGQKNWIASGFGRLNGLKSVFFVPANRWLKPPPVRGKYCLQLQQTVEIMR